MMGFLKSLVSDKSNWWLAAVMLIILAFGLNAKLHGDPISWAYCVYGVSFLIVLVVLASAIAYYKKQKSDPNG